MEIWEGSQTWFRVWFVSLPILECWWDLLFWIPATPDARQGLQDTHSTGPNWWLRVMDTEEEWWEPYSCLVFERKMLRTIFGTVCEGERWKRRSCSQKTGQKTFFPEKIGQKAYSEKLWSRKIWAEEFWPKKNWSRKNGPKNWERKGLLRLYYRYLESSWVAWGTAAIPRYPPARAGFSREPTPLGQKQ